MLINFEEMEEIAFLVYELGMVLAINGFLVDMHSFPEFASLHYDA